MIRTKKRVTNVGEDVEKAEPSCIAGGNIKPDKHFVTVLLKAKHRAILAARDPFLRHIPKGNGNSQHKNAYTNVPTPKSENDTTSTGKQMDKISDIHIREYYWATKGNEVQHILEQDEA